MTKEEAQRKAQALLVEAKEIIDVVKDLALQHELDGLNFMDMEFHTERVNYGQKCRLVTPGWFTREYWESSTADCYIDVVYPGEE